MAEWEYTTRLILRLYKNPVVSAAFNVKQEGKFEDKWWVEDPNGKSYEWNLDALNSLGKEGWELASAWPQDHILSDPLFFKEEGVHAIGVQRVMLVFKRPLGSGPIKGWSGGGVPV